MRSGTKQGLHTLRRAHEFLSGREFAVAMGDLKPHVDTLARMVQRLEQHATDQEARARSARSTTSGKHALGRSLRQEYLRPIQRLARSLFPEDANLRNAFEVSDARDDEALLQVAGGIADRAEEHKAAFIARGLSPDFVDRLRSATAAFRGAIVKRGLDLGRRSAATQGMLEEVSRGRELLRLIDDMLAPRLALRPEELAEWRTIIRVVRRRGGQGVEDGVAGSGDVPAAAGLGTPATSPNTAPVVGGPAAVGGPTVVHAPVVSTTPMSASTSEVKAA